MRGSSQHERKDHRQNNVMHPPTHIPLGAAIVAATYRGRGTFSRITLPPLACTRPGFRRVPLDFASVGCATEADVNQQFFGELAVTVTYLTTPCARFLPLPLLGLDMHGGVESASSRPVQRSMAEDAETVPRLLSTVSVPTHGQGRPSSTLSSLTLSDLISMDITRCFIY